MSFTKVMERYVSAIAKQINRKNRQGRTQFTRNENAAIRYYSDAAQKLNEMNELTPGEGFEMRSAEELAPVKLGFSTKLEVTAA